jgi:Major intrinsic protein
MATVASLATLIGLLGPVSGAHFNPAVSLVETLGGRLRWQDAVPYAMTQVARCCASAGIERRPADGACLTPLAGLSLREGRERFRGIELARRADSVRCHFLVASRN